LTGPLPPALLRSASAGTTSVAIPSTVTVGASAWASTERDPKRQWVDALEVERSAADRHRRGRSQPPRV